MKSKLHHARSKATVLAAALALAALLGVPLVQASHGAAPLRSAVVTHPPAGSPCAAGSGPGFPGYDPVHHHVFVPNENSGNITVLNGTCHKVATITLPLGASPISAAFDPANDWMYVTDDGLNQVYAIAGITVKATITSPSIQAPRQIIWDPGDSMMLLTNDFGNFSVVGIIGTSVVGQVGVGSSPQGLCYDPFWASIIVVNSLSSNVTILNAISPFSAPKANVAVGFDPQGCVFNPADNWDYVTNYGDNNVSVITGSGGSVSAVPVGALPRGIGWDQATLQVFVVDTLHGYLTLIHGLVVAKSINAGISGGEGMVYNEANDEMYIAAFTTNNVYVEP